MVRGACLCSSASVTTHIRVGGVPPVQCQRVISSSLATCRTAAGSCASRPYNLPACGSSWRLSLPVELRLAARPRWKPLVKQGLVDNPHSLPHKCAASVADAHRGYRWDPARIAGPSDHGVQHTVTVSTHPNTQNEGRARRLLSLERNAAFSLPPDSSLVLPWAVAEVQVQPQQWH